MKVFTVEHREKASNYDTSVVMLVASSLEIARDYCDENRLEETDDGMSIWSWYEITPYTVDRENVIIDAIEFWGKHGPLPVRPSQGY